MSKVLELIEKRNSAIFAARAFVESRRAGNNGVLPGEDELVYEKMEEEILAFNREIDMIEAKQDALTAGVDYATPASVNAKQNAITTSGILKGDGGGNVTAAVSGTDYATPASVNAKQNTITASGILKGAGSGSISAAVAGTDYATPTTSSRALRNSMNYYLNASTGNDDNNGTSSSTPWKTITRAVQELNKYDVFYGDFNITMTAGTYTGDFAVENKHFRQLLLQGVGTTSIVSKISVIACSGRVRFYRLQTSQRMEINAAQYALIQSSEIAGGILATGGSMVSVDNTTIRNAGMAIRSEMACVASYNNSGTGNTTALSVYQGFIFKGGTQPTGTTQESALYGGRIFGD